MLTTQQVALYPEKEEEILCLPEHRTPWAMSPHMKLAQYSHQCGPRNVWTCESNREHRSVSHREVSNMDQTGASAAVSGPWASSIWCGRAANWSGRNRDRLWSSKFFMATISWPEQNVGEQWGFSCRMRLTPPNKAVGVQTQDSLSWLLGRSSLHLAQQVVLGRRTQLLCTPDWSCSI